MNAVAMDPRLAARRIEVLRLRGRRRLRAVTTVGVVMGLAIGLFAATRSPLLDVERVTVVGLVHTAPGAVDEVTADLVGKPLLEVDVSSAEARLAALPWVRTVTSDRNLDGTVRFTLAERTAAAALSTGEGWALVDEVGRVLEVLSEAPATVPAIDGVVLEAQAGEWALERFLPAIRVAAGLPPALRSVAEVVRIAPTPEEGILLVLRDGGMVVMGEAIDLDQKFVSTATLLDQVDMYCVQAIDVRAPSVPVLTREPLCP